MPPITPAQLTAALQRAGSVLQKPSLFTKISKLKASKSPDPIQQLQTDAIIDLYDAVKQIQEAIWPVLLLIPDGLDAVKQAAGGGYATSGSAAPIAAGKIGKMPGFTQR